MGRALEVQESRAGRIPATSTRTEMKYLILTVALTAAMAGSAQTVTRDAGGNFQEMTRSHAQHDSTTTWTYTNKAGAVTPVYQGAKGGLYVWAVSAKGNPYRKYLRVGGGDHNGPK